MVDTVCFTSCIFCQHAALRKTPEAQPSVCLGCMTVTTEHCQLCNTADQPSLPEVGWPWACFAGLSCTVSTSSRLYFRHGL